MARSMTIVQRSSALNIDVPEDVAAELAELYAHLAEHPDQVGFVSFDSTDEVAEFDAQARAWAAGQGLKFRRVRSKGLPETQMKFELLVPAADEQPAGD